ncbi:hypothetical protein D3C87_1344800 [compost metagenome]
MRFFFACYLQCAHLLATIFLHGGSAISECLTAAPLNPSDEDFIALDEVAAWIDQRGSKCVSDRINRPTLQT